MTAPSKIPFNRAYQTGREARYIAEAMQGNHISGNGPFTRRAEALLKQMLGGEVDVLFTTSCTHALEMAALLLNLEPGDEVIMPSFTFVSTANAFALRGAMVRFVDIRLDTLNLDEKQVAAAVNGRTRAIVPVHYAGVGCEMEALLGLGVPVVEDAAHALGGRHHDRPLGTFGQMAALSFHETKNFSCGEGGALLLRDRQLTERAEVLREKGTDRSRFFRGEVDKYTWRDIGSSYVASDLLAAVLTCQLEAAEEIQARRSAVWERYHAAFASAEEAGLFRRPVVPAHNEHASHLYYLLCNNQQQRDELMQGLKAEGISAVFHYLPLHSSPAGQRLGQAGELPVTDDVSARLLRMPFYASLTEEDQQRVISHVLRLATSWT